MSVIDNSLFATDNEIVPQLLAMFGVSNATNSAQPGLGSHATSCLIVLYIC